MAKKKTETQKLALLIKNKTHPSQREIMYTFLSGKFKIWSDESLAYIGEISREMLLDDVNWAWFASTALDLKKKKFKPEYDDRGCWIDLGDVGVCNENRQ